MPRTALFIIAIVSAIAGSVFYFSAQDKAPESPPPSATAVTELPAAGSVKVDFELNDLNGELRNFSEWDGSYRVVNFWATWCAPCRREIPLLKTFQEQHGDEGFQVIGIAVEFPEPVIAYAEEADFNYPIVVGEQDAMEVAESSGISFIGLPFTMVVSKDGSLVGAHMGEIHQEHLDNIYSVMQQLDAGEIDIAAAKSALDLM